jgi:hypothetical protein
VWRPSFAGASAKLARLSGPLLPRLPGLGAGLLLAAVAFVAQGGAELGPATGVELALLFAGGVLCVVALALGRSTASRAHSPSRRSRY